MSIARPGGAGRGVPAEPNRFTMTKPGRATPYRVEELSGDKYASRHLAQRAAQAQLAADLAAIIRDLVTAGELAIIDGKVEAGSQPEAADK